ncbi:MAG: hypothetical protein HN368_07890 [Spirochaetales bacterium]|nr:hypothetical protein [Spirochaetales bacterium]
MERLTLLLFPSSRGLKESGKMLKGIMKHLKKTDPLVYRPVRDQVTPEFGRAMHELKNVLDDIVQVLAATIGSSDDGARLAVQKRLLNRFLHPFGITLEMCTFEYLENEGADNPEYGINDIDRIFKSRISALTQPRVALLKTGYNELEKLADLGSYDFNGLLKFFTKSYDPANKAPVMVGCTGKKIAGLLEDIYFITANLELTKNGMTVFRMLQTLDGGLVSTQEKLVRDYAEIQRIKDDFLAKDTLLDVLKVIKLDPLLVCESNNKKTNFIKEIYTSLVESYKNHRTAFMKTAAEERFKDQVSGLFKDNELTPLRGYDAETNKVLKEAGVESLKYIDGARLLKAFGELYFIPDMSNLMTKLFEIVEFASDELSHALSEAVQTCRDSFDLVQQFEVNLTDREFSTIIPIIEAIQKAKPDDGQRRKFSAAVTDLNKRFDGMLQSAMKAHRDLEQNLLLLIEEVKHGDSESVANARYLVKAHADFLQDIETTVVSINKFVRIMNQSVVDIANLKSRIASS